eukprot:gnl/TRDRNA2_/TRDRNA2_29843_c0_seq1.p1 gnl/TRDRNA2_/TRDRNA2_29843_c0~~gnl/TRDRNA2_/TRDRNA2_29843_c0_seq1.p1  ORF type:complete len:550 (+),score=75.96 gnl/TRDRNA2_/TRDRNA2_29843_c0_seq1:72-1721(+)
MLVSTIATRPGARPAVQPARTQPGAIIPRAGATWFEAGDVSPSPPPRPSRSPPRGTALSSAAGQNLWNSNLLAQPPISFPAGVPTAAPYSLDQEVNFAHAAPPADPAALSADAVLNNKRQLFTHLSYLKMLIDLRYDSERVAAERYQVQHYLEKMSSSIAILQAQCCCTSELEEVLGHLRLLVSPARFHEVPHQLLVAHVEDLHRSPLWRRLDLLQVKGGSTSGSESGPGGCTGYTGMDWISRAEPFRGQVPVQRGTCQQAMHLEGLLGQQGALDVTNGYHMTSSTSTMTPTTPGEPSWAPTTPGEPSRDWDEHRSNSRQRMYSETRLHECQAPQYGERNNYRDLWVESERAPSTWFDRERFRQGWASEPFLEQVELPSPKVGTMRKRQAAMFLQEPSLVGQACSVMVREHGGRESRWLPAIVEGFDEPSGLYHIVWGDGQVMRDVPAEQIRAPARDFWPPGTPVEYWCQAHQGWMPAQVISFDNHAHWGVSYDLDVELQVPPGRIRPRSVPVGRHGAEAMCDRCGCGHGGCDNPRSCAGQQLKICLQM